MKIRSDFFGFFLTTLVGAFLATSCASISPKKNNQELQLTDASHAERPKIASTPSHGLVDYKFDNQPYKAEWLACQIPSGKAAVMLMNRDMAAFDDKTFCEGWIAQAFLSAGYHVVTVNRPGYGESTGTPDFAGPQSVTAIEAGANAVRASAPALRNIIGIWGYSSGATAAAFASKKIKEVQWIILGAGVYDAEVTYKTTQDKLIKSELEMAVKSGGEAAFEPRSIAWDTSNLPKRIILYHGKDDVSVPPSQAAAFRDALATSEYNVVLQVIEGLNHEIGWEHHQQLLEVIIRSLN